MQNRKRFLSHPLVWLALAILTVYLVLWTQTLHQKFAIAFTLGVTFSPLILVLRPRNWERFLLALWLFALPLGAGWEVLRHTATTYTEVQMSLKFYLCDLLLLVLIVMRVFRVLSRADARAHWFRDCRWLLLPMGLWIMMGAISIYPAIDNVAAASEVVKMVRIFLTFYIVFQFVKNERDIHFVLLCVFAALLFQSLLMVVQYATESIVLRLPGHTDELDVVEQGFRPFGTMFHSSHPAKLFGLLLPVALGWFFFARTKFQRVFLFSVWVAGSIALILTISRAGLATWLFSMFALAGGVVVCRIVMARQVFPVFGVLLFWSVVFSGLLLGVGGGRLADRMTSDSGSFDTRAPMDRVALRMIATRPFVGVGLRNYTMRHSWYDFTPERITNMMYDQPVHNLYLLYAAETGVLGAVGFIWFLVALVVICMRHARHPVATRMDRVIFLGMAVGIVSIMIQSVTGKGVVDNLVHLSSIAIFAGCAARMSVFLKDRQAALARQDAPPEQ